MTAISSMKSETMTKISDIVDGMVDAFSAGESPSEFLAKSAIDHDLTADQIRLSARAFNVGTTNGRRKTAGLLDCVSKAEEKVSFDSVDAEKIVSSLFSKDKITKSAGHQSAVDPVYSSEFSHPQYRQIIESEKKADYLEKGLQLLDKDPKPEKLAYSGEAVQMAPWAAVQNARKDVESARYRHMTAVENLRSSIDKLASYFLDARQYHGKVSWPSFRKRAEFLFGSEVLPVLDRIEPRLPKSDVKVASVPDNSDASSGPYSLLQALLKRADELNQAVILRNDKLDLLKKAESKMPEKPQRRFLRSPGYSFLGRSKEASRKEQLDQEMTRMVREVSREAAIKAAECRGAEVSRKPISLLKIMKGELTHPEEDKTKKASTFAPIFASTLGAGVGREVGSHIPGAVPIEKLEEAGYNKLTDPEQERALAAIRAEAMLSNLINSDDVLSYQDPGEVVRSYNELSQLVPGIMSQPASARAILRQVTTTGGLTPYDLEQLQRMNSLASRSPARPPTNN